MAAMFETRIDIEGIDGKPSHVTLTGPVAMTDHELMRFVVLSVVSRRFGDTDIPLSGSDYAERLVNATVLLTNVESLLQEELRKDFKLYAAIDKTALNLMSQMEEKPEPPKPPKKFPLMSKGGLLYLGVLVLALILVNAMLH